MTTLPRAQWLIGAFSLLLVLFSSSCATQPGSITQRKGDEIIVAGKLVHTGTRVVTWLDPGGYDAYRVEQRFAPLAQSDWKTSHEKNPELESPNRYGLRKVPLTDEEIERVRGGGWDLPLLQRVVDQFVIHYDETGTSRQCFKVLHDMRNLSVHFLLDLDGTIYQTLDLKERAWHATTSNTRSIGIEIANVGAYEADQQSVLAQWFKRENGTTTLTVPRAAQPDGIRTPGFVGHPARPNPVMGEIQHKQLTQYDFTPQQYEALVKLTATLCRVFPKLKCDYPSDASGRLVTEKLPDAELEKYEGLIAHYHIQTNKVDPGPAFQWDYVIGNTRRILNQRNELRNSAMPVPLQRDN